MHAVPLGLAALVATQILTAGCGNGPRPDSSGTARKIPATSVAAVAVTPATGSQPLRPDTRVMVSVRDGTLSSVRVRGTTDGKTVTGVPGDVSTDSTHWTASTMLLPSTQYTVRVVAVDARGLGRTVTTDFRTIPVPRSHRMKASTVSPQAGSVVGVAQPLVVGFNRPVRNRAAVQRTLRVETTPQVHGAWYWVDSSHVHYRPQRFWQPGTRVTLHANLTGVDAGNGSWGAANRTVSYQIGRSQIIRVDVRRLRMTVERDGRAIHSFRVTSGKRGWETRNGTKVIMEKDLNKTWTNDRIGAPEEYTLHSRWALRMTNSGEFIHDAPWSIGNLGRRSASHGCVGMRPRDAQWLFANTILGDPVVVTGSPRPYTGIWNRYADWNVPWPAWVAGRPF